MEWCSAERVFLTLTLGNIAKLQTRHEHEQGSAEHDSYTKWRSTATRDRWQTTGQNTRNAPTRKAALGGNLTDKVYSSIKWLLS